VIDGRHRFRPEQRLRTGAQYERVYKQGARAGDAVFQVHALPNGLSHARLGMSVSARTVGNAVNRNRVRRLIREVFRHECGLMPPVDVVVTSRPGARDATREQRIDSLLRQMKLAIRKAATDTSRSAAQAARPRPAPAPPTPVEPAPPEQD
jgi:ribonuclease P protein component